MFIVIHWGTKKGGWGGWGGTLFIEYLAKRINKHVTSQQQPFAFTVLFPVFALSSFVQSPKARRI